MRRWRALPTNRAALPHSSAKGPVNLVGFMIENISTGILKQFHIALLFINFSQKLPIDRIKEFQGLKVRVSTEEREEGEIAPAGTVDMRA